MMEKDFEKALLNDPQITSTKSVASRMAKARKAEEILGVSLDITVSDDERMYESLLVLQQHDNPSSAPLQNALRKYYKFKNQREFPRLRDYRKSHP